MRMDKPLEIGETNRSQSEDIFYGGKGINVSRVLCALGVENTALGFVAGFTGSVIDEELKKLGICTDFITVKKGFSRINVKLKGAQETEINAKGPEIDSEEVERLFSRIEQMKEDDYLVLAGSIPGSLPNDIYEKIFGKNSWEGDSRSSRCYGKSSSENALLSSILIKPNRQELADLFGVTIESDAETVEYAQRLQDEGAENVLISMGGDGAILVDRDEKCL